MEAAIFTLLAVVTLVPAVLVVTVKNVFHAALWLIASLLGVAGFYAMLAADFLFAVQLMVYAGGIMVILLFVILLSGKPSDWAIRQLSENAWAAGVFAACFIALLVSALYHWPVLSHVSEPVATTGELGLLLLKDLVLPFEVIGLVLVAAMIGAVYFSVKRSDS